MTIGTGIAVVGIWAGTAAVAYFAKDELSAFGFLMVCIVATVASCNLPFH